MTKQSNPGKAILDHLARNYSIQQHNIGTDARLAKKSVTLWTESYTVKGIGHLCIQRLKAMLGLMKMETVFFVPTKKDAPLMNLDWMKAVGKEFQIVELYDTQLEPYPEEYLGAFERIRERDADLADYTFEQSEWISSVQYPCSYHKTGKGISDRLKEAAKAYYHTYEKQLAALPACDQAQKAEKVRFFAETLFSGGGPVIDQVKKLFGEDTAKRLILTHMYGLENDD